MTISKNLLALFAFLLPASLYVSEATYADVSSAAISSNQTSQNQTVSLPQDSRVPGGVAVIPLAPAYKNSKISFNGKPVWIINNNDQYWAVIGIPLSQKIGQLTYKIDEKIHSINIEDKSYREQHLTVKKKHANPPSYDMPRIRKESKLSKDAFNLFTDINKDKPYHQLLTPAQGPISSPFGLKRFFNEQPRRPHSGLDIAAPRGADIIAPMDGKIVLTGKFFFNGYSIFIDHGQGLVTMYCHMDKLESQEGQWVKAGDVIGKVGSTGRATGPHLHWTVSLNNTRIDPLLFIDEPQK